MLTGGKDRNVSAKSLLNYELQEVNKKE